MGVWGAGLYSSDFALDLRSAIAGLCRLPLDAQGILSQLCDLEPCAADPRNEDYATFWLVTADQLQRRGIPCAKATSLALELLERQVDLKTPRLGRLRSRLAAGTIEKKRRTLARPQPFVMDVGDVFVYPTSRSRPLSALVKRRDDNFRPPYNWTHDGWSALVIVNRGLAFGYLAWYSGLVLNAPYEDKPAMDVLRQHVGWVISLPGTCSQLQFDRLELEQVAKLSIDTRAAERLLPSMRMCASATASEITIGNRMTAKNPMTWKGPSEMIECLADVLA